MHMNSLLCVVSPFYFFYERLNPKHLDAHAIYLLNLLLAFLQPRFDPSLQDDLLADEIEEGSDPVSPLPSQRDDEFRPFVRRLPEWQFWCVSCFVFCLFQESTSTSLQNAGCLQLARHW